MRQIEPLVECVENEISYANKELVKPAERKEFARMAVQLVATFFSEEIVHALSEILDKDMEREIGAYRAEPQEDEDGVAHTHILETATAAIHTISNAVYPIRHEVKTNTADLASQQKALAQLRQVGLDFLELARKGGVR